MITQAALRAAAELADAIGASEEAVKWQLAAEDMGKAARKQLLNQETGYFFKWVKRGNQQANPTVDASGFYAAWMYGLHQPDEETMVQALSTLLKTFKQEEKFSGIPRYLNDMYHSGDPKALGNPWFITSLWLAQYYIQTGDMDKAAEIVAWTEAAMLPTGALSEQLNGKTGESLSVAPLTWSQAEYVSTLLDYYAAKSHRTTEKVRHANWTGHKAESATTGSQGPRIIPVIQA
jgi:GH15 family glucan-1,4-alpha-glucosidase